MIIGLAQFMFGTTGESIANLHRQLTLHGFHVPVSELQEDRLGPGTQAAITQFQVSQNLPAHGLIDELTARGLGLGGDPKSIAGLVCKPDGTPLENVAVHVYTVGPRGEKVIAETRSAGDGKFTLPWPHNFTSGLNIRADGGSAKPVPWKTVTPGSSAWVRLSVGGEYRGASKFDLLTATLMPAVGDSAFHTMGGTGRASDLAALAETIGAPARDVSRLVLAHKLADKSKLDPRVVFALLTELVTGDMIEPGVGDSEALDDAHVDHVLDLMLRQRRDVVDEALKAAIASNVIGGADVDAAVEQLHELRLEHIAAQPLTWSVSLATSHTHECCAAAVQHNVNREASDSDESAHATARSLQVSDAALHDVLATSITDPAAQRSVLEAFAAHDGYAKLASVADNAAGLTVAQRNHLRFTLETAVLLGNHLPLVEHIQTLHATGVVKTQGDLARFDQADWADMLRRADPSAEHIALPASHQLAAAPAGDRIEHVAKMLARRFEVSHPTTALTGRLAKDPGQLPLASSKGVHSFLENSPDFCVRHMHIDRFVKDNPDALPAGEDHQQVIADLKTLQRAYKLTPRFAHAKAMLAAGHASAQSVYTAGVAKFTAQMTAQGATESEAKTMFNNAAQVHATAVTLMTNFHSAFTGTTPAAVAARVSLDEVAPPASFPTIQNLFGPTSYCTCADCRAIHGPAAYLVDILQFLNARMTAGTSACTQLFSRRPDIQFIQLSCDNTNDLVPYIDLVCEILEDAVSVPASGALALRQTSGSADQLRAVPQFVSDAAYGILRQTVFPLTAPFDLYASEIRAFFRQLGVKWHELLAAWQVSSNPSDTVIAGERYGFSANALNIITTAAPAQPWTLWDLGNTNTGADTAVTFIGASTPTTSRTTSIVLTPPAGIVAGDTLIYITWSAKTTDSSLNTSTLPTGWSTMTPVIALSSGGSVNVLRRIATSSEPATHTFTVVSTGTGNPLLGVAVVYRNLDPNAALVASATTDVSTATTSFTAPSVSTTTYSDLYVGFIADHLTSGTATAPTGTTKHVDKALTTDGGAHCAVFDLTPNAVGPTAAQAATLSAASTGVALSLAFAKQRPQVADPNSPGVVKSGLWTTILAYVPILLDRAKIQHRELVQLLQTQFINPPTPPTGSTRISPLTITETGSGTPAFATCDASKQTVVGWTSDLLTRFNRFIRLWRQLGCTIWDLDKMLCMQAVGNTSLDANALANFGRVEAIAARLPGPRDELLTLWGDIDHVDYLDVLDTPEEVVPSVYRRWFRNASVTLASPVFVDNPASLTGTLNNVDVIAGLVAALNISAGDLQRILTAAGLAGTAALNLTNLSTITRYAIFANRLGLSISDLITTIGIVGTNPLAGTLSPTATLQFFTSYDQIQNSGFSVLELSYLLRHGAVVDSGIGLTDNAITAWLEDLRRALVRLGPPVVRPGDSSAAVAAATAAAAAAAATLVIQRISSALPLDQLLVQQLLQATLPGGSSTLAALFTQTALTARNTDGTFTTATSRANFSTIYDAYTVLDKVRIVLTRWQVSKTDALWLAQNSVAAGWMGLHTLPASAAAAADTTHPTATLAQLDTLHSNVVVQQTMASPTGTRLFDFVLTPGSSLAAGVANVAALGNWSTTDITAVATRLALSSAASLVAGTTVAKIRDLMAWPRKLGTDVPTTLSFVTTTVDSTLSRKARQLAKGKFTNDQWLAVAGQVQDGLRNQKRAALVDWLLARPNPTRSQVWGSADNLYDYFLIDPEMAASQTTTRIKQAISAAQLFVQRCQLQLEPTVTADASADPGWSQWEWMKRFSVWQADRKVFLYPENWFDPSLRSDMSPYFADFINALQQADLTNDLAEDALREYMQKLSDVAHLEVSGIWEQTVSGQPSILHVVGRTRKMPYVYSYRQRASSGAWSPWEPLDAGVDNSPVMPVIWNNRLFMVWAEFTQKSLPATDAERTIPQPSTIPSGGAITHDTTKYWEITLAWIERRNDIWLPKRQSQRKQILSSTGATLREIVLRTFTPGRNLVVDLYQPVVTPGVPTRLSVEWLLTSAQDEPVLMNNTNRATPGLGALEDLLYCSPVTGGDPKMGSMPQVAGNDMSWSFNAYGGNNAGITGALTLNKIDNQGNGGFQPIVSNISQARVISVRFGERDQFQSPFFISDPQRTFFANDSTWNLQTFYHPYTELFVQQLNSGGIPALYSSALQTSPDSLRGTPVFDFNATYTASSFVTTPYPTETIDYTLSGPYSIYNWELFFHAPLLIAMRLAANQRFEDALTWFHYIFNPTVVSSTVAAPARYWNPMVFRALSGPDYTNEQIETLLQLVNEGAAAPPAAAAAAAAAVQSVVTWRNDPFDPNAVAQARPVAYQKAVVMQYITTLIAWGDQLFRGNSIELVNEATQLYILASELLGPRPQSLRAIEPNAPKSYNDLATEILPAGSATQIDAFSNSVAMIENLVSVPPPGDASTPPTPTLNTFYFCIPPNDQMLGYWDTVADRLFKVRNGLDINGVARSLPLFDAPIDPGLLVRAAAAGLDASAALSAATVDLLPYRFSTVWQIAHDLCQDLRGLGSAILSALDRRDGEEMARLRSTQEIAVQDAMRLIKSRQLDEANGNRAALAESRQLAVMRSQYYASREFMNAAETQAHQLGQDSLDLTSAGVIADIVSGATALLPTLQGGASGVGGSPVVTALFGGEHLSRNAAAVATVLRGYASLRSQKAGLSTALASYQRRADDWDLQRRLADQETAQIDAQLAAADIRVDIAQKELNLQIQQVQNARDTDALLHSKFTNQELYDWMLSQLSATYFQAYQLAYDLAKRASAAYQFELAVADPGIIQFGYWDSLHQGLVAGDKLLLDLRRLQTTHLSLNTREYELTKHVSLLQLAPQALITLRQNGSCFFNLPEKMFDLDQPGHYLRRLKSVSVTLPCVTGPYTSVNAKLTLVSHSTRVTTDIATSPYYPTLDSDGLPPNTTSDTRFARSAGVAGAVPAVALSTGRDDAGMFEVNFHDERYLPFEGLGAISHWFLELPKGTNQFDLQTLSDVIVHVRYTARDGGLNFQNFVASQAITTPPTPLSGFQLLSARTEFPDAYARLFAPTGSGQSLDLALGPQHFPFIPNNDQINITAISAILLFTSDSTYAPYQGLASTAQLTAHFGFSTVDGTPPTTTSTFTAVAATLGGVPVAQLTLAGPVGPVSLAFVETDLAAATLLDQSVTAADGTMHNRLNQAMIDDILILVTYQIGTKS